MLWPGAKVPLDLPQKHRLICRKSSGYALWFVDSKVDFRQNQVSSVFKVFEDILSFFHSINNKNNQTILGILTETMYLC